jgi:polyvinyl alcohol dehydrogenase (cytochrome)
VALDLATGSERWRHNLVATAQPLPASAAPFLLGPAGADIWSQPTYDADTNTIYASTGQNLSPDAEGHSTPTSDAIVAVDIATGARKWVHQFTANDIWAVGVTNPNPVTGQPIDMDLGDAPKIYRLHDGRKVVGAGQKDGRYHVLDAATGELVRTTAVIPARNDLGGFQTGGAFADGTVFQHGLRPWSAGSPWPTTSSISSRRWKRPCRAAIRRCGRSTPSMPGRGPCASDSRFPAVPSAARSSRTVMST